MNTSFNPCRDLAYFFIFISLFFYIASFFFPAFRCGGSRGWLGYEVFFIGWAGLVTLDPRWFANFTLLYLWKWVLSPDKKSLPKIALVFTLLSGLSVMVLPNPVACPGGSGAPGQTTGLAMGGYIWAIALISTTVAVWVLRPAHHVPDDLADSDIEQCPTPSMRTEIQLFLF